MNDSIKQSALSPEEFRYSVLPIGTWHKWLELAQAATTLEEKMGLLHVGFETRVDEAPYGVTYTPADRLQFYFGVADGWTSSSDLREPGLLAGDDPEYHHVGWDKNGHAIKRTRSEQRRVLATKAFKMLATEFFKHWLDKVAERRKYGTDPTGWHETLLTNPVFPVIRNFFRCEDRRYGVRNLSWFWSEERWSPQEKIVLEFLFLLPEALWTWKEDEIKSYDKPDTALEKQQRNEKTRLIVEDGKVWIVEVLSNLRRLDLIEKWLLDLGEPCLKKLEEIALANKLEGYKHPVRGERPVATVKEACIVGSPAALLLLRYQVVQAELARLEDIRAAEVAAAQAAQAEAERVRRVAQAAAAIQAAHAVLAANGQVDEDGSSLNAP